MLKEESVQKRTTWDRGSEQRGGGGTVEKRAGKSGEKGVKYGRKLGEKIGLWANACSSCGTRARTKKDREKRRASY